MRQPDAEQLRRKWQALSLHATTANRELRDYTSGSCLPQDDQHFTDDAQVTRAEVVLSLAQELVEYTRFLVEPPTPPRGTWKGSVVA